MENMTRRSFIAASTAAAMGPMILGAQDKAGTKRPIVGEGNHQYEVIHDWGELPSDIKYGNTHSVSEDSRGHIYVHHTVHATSQSPDSVVVFDDKGKFVRSFGAMFKGGAHGMHLQKEGTDEYLYFCDEKHGIVTKRTLRGEEVWTRGYPQESAPYARGAGNRGLPYRPTNIAIAPNGEFWVADGYGSYYIHHYNSKVQLLNTFGGSGVVRSQEPGQGQRSDQAQSLEPAALGTLNNPHGIWVDTRDPANPILLVADRFNHRIQRFTLDDKPVDVVEGTLLPCHFTQQKDLMVVPDLQCRVTLLDKENKFIAHLGDGAYGKEMDKIRTATDRSQFEPGKFIAPHGATFDHAGNIFVVEFVEIGRVTKLRKLV
jgi:hypothetical protein